MSSRRSTRRPAGVGASVAEVAEDLLDGSRVAELGPRTLVAAIGASHHRGMQDDRSSESLEVLEHDECVHLLSVMSIGRVAVAVEDLPPLVVPVNYVLDGEAIVFRTGAGSKLRAMREAPVSFQVDLIDPVHRSGWSVLVRGIASQVTDREVEHLIVDTWAPGDQHHWIRVLPFAITGRRIRLPEVAWQSRGYV